MRKLPWAALGLLAAAAMANVVFVGCGSEDDSPIADVPDGGDEDTSNARHGHHPSSTAERTASSRRSTAAARTPPTASSSPRRARPAPTAAAATATRRRSSARRRSRPAPRRSGVRNRKRVLHALVHRRQRARAKLCVADNLACAIDGECCGGKCGPDGQGGGICTPLNGGGPKTDGNPCVDNTDCASKLCNGGICVELLVLRPDRRAVRGRLRLLRRRLHQGGGLDARRLRADQGERRRRLRSRRHALHAHGRRLRRRLLHALVRAVRRDQGQRLPAGLGLPRHGRSLPRRQRLLRLVGLSRSEDGLRRRAARTSPPRSSASATTAARAASPARSAARPSRRTASRSPSAARRTTAASSRAAAPASATRPGEVLPP